MDEHNLANSFEEMQSAFSFLVDEYHFKLVRNERMNYGYILEYLFKELKIYIYCDYMENRITFFLIKGSKTSEFDNESGNVKWFFDLFKKYEPSLEFKELQPDASGNYKKAVSRNIELLRKYGDAILLSGGDKWF